MPLIHLLLSGCHLVGRDLYDIGACGVFEHLEIIMAREIFHTIFHIEIGLVLNFMPEMVS